MNLPNFKRLPRHVGIIPDGNRRWSQDRGMGKEAGYAHGINPGFRLFDIFNKLGIEEMTFYGFTQDNTKRPSEQTIAFQKACVDAVELLSRMDASLLVVGDDESPLFPDELRPYCTRHDFGKGGLRVNLLVNYDWHWDLSQALRSQDYADRSRKTFAESIGSADVSRIDLIVRWGGRRRLSGLLPVQSVYADFYVLDALWPDYEPQHFFDALRWYENQDVTLGG